MDMHRRMPPQSRRVRGSRDIVVGKILLGRVRDAGSGAKWPLPRPCFLSLLSTAERALPAYRPYYRAYLLQKGPRLMGQAAMEHAWRVRQGGFPKTIAPSRRSGMNPSVHTVVCNARPAISHSTRKSERIALVGNATQYFSRCQGV